MFISFCIHIYSRHRPQRIHMCVYIYIHLYIHTYMRIFVYRHTCLYPFVYIYIAGTGRCGLWLWPHKEGQKRCGSDCGTESPRKNGMYKLHIYIHICTYIYICIYIHVCMNMDMLISIEHVRIEHAIIGWDKLIERMWNRKSA